MATNNFKTKNRKICDVNPIGLTPNMNVLCCLSNVFLGALSFGNFFVFHSILLSISFSYQDIT